MNPRSAVARLAAAGALLLSPSLLPPGAAAAGPAAELPRTFRLRIHVAEGLPQLASALRAQDFDVTYVDAKRGVVELIGGAAEMEQLRGYGLAPEIVDGPPSPDALADYLSPAEIAARLAQYEAAYPGLARRVAYATDHEGRTAFAIKISDNVALDEDEPSLLFIAQHHAREVMTPEVALDIVDQLLANYASDATIRRWVDDNEVWVVPTHNPDGSDFVFTGNSNWRKNRRDNGDGSFGVDPNRNWPFDWNKCGGSSGSPGSDTYRGPAPGSEPTTAGLANLAREQRPVFYVSYHTYGEYALHAFGCSNVYPTPPDFRTLREVSNEASTTIPGDAPNSWYAFGTPWELLYDVDGDADGWFYGELGSVGVTYELNASAQGFQPDYATWRDTTVERARGGWRYFFERLDGPRITGHVTDACTGAPLPLASVGLAEQVFASGETPRTSTPIFGRIDWPVMPGTYTLQVGAAGYSPQSWPTTVGFAPERREIALVPDGSGGAALVSIRVDDTLGDRDGQADPGETVDLYVTALATGAALPAFTATASESDPFLAIVDGTAALPALAPAGQGEALDPIRVAIAADAPDDTPASLTIAFAAPAPFCAPPATAALRLTRGFPSCPAVDERLDVDPGWTIDNGAASGGWAFGAPSVVGPPAAFSGVNVYGTNLSGNYADGGRYFLTAGPYDLSDLRHTELRFARWLESEPGWDIARVEVRTDSNPAWRVAWEGFGRDTEWYVVRRDVAALVDGESGVSVRFSLQADGSTNDAGFYVDDLAFCGEQQAAGGPRVKYAAHAVDDSDPAYANANGQVDPGETFVLRVDARNTGGAPASGVTGVLSSATPGVTIHNAVADWPDLGAGALAGSLAPHFTVSTAGACGATLTFTLTLRWQDGGRSTGTFAVPVGELREVTRLSSDMEADGGWTPGGNAKAGAFVRQDPNPVTDPDAGAVQPDDDTTPAPGAACWVTGNPPTPPGFNARLGDVDRGTALVVSPAFDGTGSGGLVLAFSRWFHRSGLSPLDNAYYTAQVSTDGGAAWTTVERLDANASAWTRKEFDLATAVTPTSTMRVRFTATEDARTTADPLVELLIDDVSVVRRTILCDGYTAPDTRAPNPVGNSLVASRSGEDVGLTWAAPPVDALHDPARFYPVYRSAAPSGGFTAAGDPSSPAWRDAGNGAAGTGTFFYLVAARNAAGDSGETP